MSLTDWLARWRGRKRSDSLGRPVRDLSSILKAQWDELEDTVRQLKKGEAGLAHALDHLSAEAMNDVRRSVKSLTEAVRRQMDVNSVPRAQHGTSRRTFDQLALIGDSTRPILVGPWTGDVAVELLYWVPFVRWFTRRFSVPPERVHAISRGGAPWYSDIAETYTDVLTVCSDSEFRAHASESMAAPVEEFAEEVAARVLRGDRDSYALLHPGSMHSLFAPYWDHEASPQDVSRLSIPQLPLSFPPLGVPSLPERYTAVRFAFSESFPDTTTHREWLDQLLTSLTSSGEVVWVGKGLDGVDGFQQTEYVPPVGLRLHRIDHLLSPERSLAVQTAVIANAEAYIGTYGGLAYVAALCGVQSVTFYSSRAFFAHYRRMADLGFGGRTCKAPVVLDVANEALLRGVLGVGTGSSQELIT
jgi:hypothetical protein